MSTQPVPPAPLPTDFLGIGRLLSDEERMLQETVRRFVGDRVLPEIAGWYEQGAFPWEMAPR